MMATAIRAFLVILGGYAAISAFVAALAETSVFFGMARSEAAALAAMLGFITYLVLILWGFVERRLWFLTAAIGLITFTGAAVTLLLHLV